MVYKYSASEPRWINFENPTGEKGKAVLQTTGQKVMRLSRLPRMKKKFFAILTDAG